MSKLTQTIPASLRRITGFALIFCAASSYAAPLPVDLTATGSISFGGFSRDLGTETDLINTGVTAGGSDTTGVFSAGLGGPSPIMDTLTDMGDGVFYTASFDTNAPFGGNPSSIQGSVDFSIDLTNSSATDTLTVTIEIDFSNSVGISGDSDAVDAGASGDLGVPLAPLLSNLTSDGFFGDEINGVPQGTFGAPIAQSDLISFDVVLGVVGSGTDTASVVGNYNYFGENFDGTNAFGDSMMSMRITNVTAERENPDPDPDPDPDPNGVPAPGTLALLGIGLLALARRRTV